MVDEADRAEVERQRRLDTAIAKRRPVPDIQPRGTCHWCEAPVGPKQRFCDNECGDDFKRAWQKGEIDHHDIH